MPGNRKIAIILGSGLYDMFQSETGLNARVDTKYGTADATELFDDAYLMLRHGASHSVPPHLINYRANIEALQKLGVSFVLSTASVGSLRPSILVGSYVVLDQFIDETKGRVETFYTEPGEPFAHVDMTQPYSESVRNALISGLKKSGANFHSTGTYVCTEGPRFETPAEIRMYQKAGGDVVGMTGVPEVVLAGEIGLEYGSLAFVTNMAAGMQKEVSQGEVNEKMKESLSKTKAVIESAIGELSK
ncbi:MAG TPA: MTAP family purine nucleoside phosphorylase [Nitrososphaerales archaeon]|nr:MTAP family purine nucleoside phosphorylase [Nitrososphaerales archaeon]